MMYKILYLGYEDTRTRALRRWRLKGAFDVVLDIGLGNGVWIITVQLCIARHLSASSPHVAYKV